MEGEPGRPSSSIICVFVYVSKYCKSVVFFLRKVIGLSRAHAPYSAGIARSVGPSLVGPLRSGPANEGVGGLRVWLFFKAFIPRDFE